MKSRKKRIVFLIIMFAVVIYVGMSLWISVNYLIVRDYFIETDQQAGSFRTVVISDLHDHSFGYENEDLVEKIKMQRPDLILMDGDMLNAQSKNAAIPVELIGSLANIAPVYYAMGNHEEMYIENGHPQFVSQLEEAGAVVLDKTYSDIEVNGVPVRLGGMYDYAFGVNSTMDETNDVFRFLYNFQDTDRLTIMLSHRPDSFIFGNASKLWDIDLVISGHNHGGQVVFPFLGGLYGGDQGWFPKYVHGVFQKDKLQLFITSGLGTKDEKLPRFNNPPEIAVLTIS